MDIKQLQTKFEAYLLTEQRVAINTFLSYKRDINQFVGFLEKQVIVFDTITADELKQFVRYLYGLKLTARSIGRKISTLKTFFTYLSSHFNIKNYAKELLIPKLEKRLPSYLTLEEVARVLAYSEQDRSPLGIRNSIMIYLLYGSGMRVSELVNIKIIDIHFDTRFISIEGKGGKQRMIPIPQSVMTLLCTYVQTQISTLMPHSIKDPIYLFPILYGKKIKSISRQSCWIILKKICEKAGIKRAISPHQLRHSFATHMLAQGVDLRSLQVLLGHEEITTVEIYTHVETSQLRNIYDKKHPRS
jgi:integrase/recombinase XerD